MKKNYRNFDIYTEKKFKQSCIALQVLKLISLMLLTLISIWLYLLIANIIVHEMFSSSTFALRQTPTLFSSGMIPLAIVFWSACILVLLFLKEKLESAAIEFWERPLSSMELEEVRTIIGEQNFVQISQTYLKSPLTFFNINMFLKYKVIDHEPS